MPNLMVHGVCLDVVDDLERAVVVMAEILNNSAAR